MPPVAGNYSKTIKGGYDEEERLQIGLVQKGIPIVDADENRKEFIRLTWLRRALETVIGDASPNDGFKIVGDSTANDFLITGGDGTLDNAGRIWVRGLHAFIKATSIRYKNNGSTADQQACLPKVVSITGVGNTVLEDTAADYVASSLVGRTLVPDVSLGVTAVITANTDKTITVGIDLTAAGVTPGAFYRVEMRTPSGAGRNDGVYLNVSLDEVDSTELPSLLHNLGTLMGAQNFGQIRHVIEVHEGDSVGLPGALDAKYVDADGFDHYRVKIADVTRIDGQAAINLADVLDRRATSANFATFLRKTGDNMTGDLTMLGGTDILLPGGGTVDGRDVSVDGAKLDTIDWTGQGAADLLPKTSAFVAGTALTAFAGITKNVSEFLRTKTAGGLVSGTKGVVTTAPDNIVVIRRASTDDQPILANGSGAFGRLTEVHPFPNITGTWTFTNAAFGVIGSGGVALTQLQAGDIVRGPDSLYYTVDVISGDNAFTIKEPFAGATGPVTAPAARRFVLTLRVNNAGVEQDFSMTADAVPAGAADLDWYYHEVFDYASRPVRDSTAAIVNNKVAAMVPDATTAISGKVQLSADLGTTAGQVVQASDTRLGRVKGRNGGTLSALKAEIEIAVGSGLSVAMVESGDKVTFTLTNTSPGAGAGFPGFGGGAPGADSGSGTAGSSGLASDHGHVHPLSSSYQVRRAFNTFSASSAPSVTTGFTPRVFLFVAVMSEGGVSIGGGIGVGSQGSTYHNGTLQLGIFTSGQVLSGPTTFAVAQFDATQVLLNRTGAGTATGLGLVIGDNLP